MRWRFFARPMRLTPWRFVRRPALNQDFRAVPLPDADAGDDNALLGLVAEFAGLVEARRSVDAFDGALLAPLLLALPLELGEFPVAGIPPGFLDVGVEASCHVLSAGVAWFNPRGTQRLTDHIPS